MYPNTLRVVSAPVRRSEEQTPARPVEYLTSSLGLLVDDKALVKELQNLGGNRMKSMYLYNAPTISSPLCTSRVLPTRSFRIRDILSVRLNTPLLPR